VSHVALQLLRIPETRKKILMTLGILVAFRVGHHVPIPGMSPDFLRQLSERGGSTAFGLLSAFSGGAIGDTVIFALGIMPYISASIIFSILTKVSPQIEALQKEGATGIKKINQWTRLSTVPIALLQAFMIWFGVFKRDPSILAGSADTGFGTMMVVVTALTAGAVCVMWMGELITEYGIGNGSSILIMANIIARMPSSISALLGQQEDAYNALLTLSAIWIGIVLVVIYIQKGERRIPIQYARLTRGRRVYGGQRHYLPLKINMAGVMPIVFASTIFIVPTVIFPLVGWDTLAAVFNDTASFLYVAFEMALVFGFCFFWNNLMFRPEEIADNLREHGSFIPGIRPGAKTATFLKESLTRITLAGAVFLAIIAVLPGMITGGIPGLNASLAYFLGGTSVLIVVGVAMDTADKLNAQLVMRNYEGFMQGRSAPGAGLAGGTTGGWARRK
jgi:preprotein translocase subunit SecY